MNRRRYHPSTEGVGYPSGKRVDDPRSQFKELSASKLYCPKCRVATPVRERLLLVLPTGSDLYDYMCTQCGESVGTKTG
jgi:hypothetical protein